MRRITVVILALIFTACSLVPAGQGIRGMVLSGPNCPVMQEGVPCPDKPLQIDLVVTDRDGMKVIKRFSSLADGTFEVTLPVGIYSIRSLDPASLPSCSISEPVQVFEGAMTETVIFCDKGIR